MSGVIYIMWLRQIKRYIRSKSRIIGSLGQPILFFIALGFGFGTMYQQAQGGSYIEFLASGIIAMSVLFTALFNGIEVIWDRQFGFLKETLVAPVSRTSIMIGKALGGATVAFLQGMLVFLLTILFGFEPNYMMIPVAMGFVFMTALFFSSMGIAIASKMSDMHGFQLIMNFLVMPLFFLSGALFPLENLPEALKYVTYLNPLSYGVDGIRGALSSMTTFGLGVDFVVMGFLCILMLLIGSYSFSKTEV